MSFTSIGDQTNCLSIAVQDIPLQCGGEVFLRHRDCGQIHPSGDALFASTLQTKVTAVIPSLAMIPEKSA